MPLLRMKAAVLLVANYLGGLETLSTAALESGSGPVLLAQVPSRGRGDDEVVVDGSYAFVPEEVSGDVAVYDLGQFLRATGLPRAPHEVGSIPIGPSPSGVALDLPAGRLYVISQAGATVEGYGELTAVDIAEAESHPGRAVLGAVAAGCDPVRVALSGGGTVAWVTDRGADTLLALGLTQRPKAAVGHVIAAVRVGPNPVDVTLVDDGSVVLVTDSARYRTPDEASTVAAVDAADALAGHPSLLGYLSAGAFPRQFGARRRRAAALHRLQQHGRTCHQRHRCAVARGPKAIVHRCAPPPPRRSGTPTRSAPVRLSSPLRS